MSEAPPLAEIGGGHRARCFFAAAAEMPQIENVTEAIIALASERGLSEQVFDAGAGSLY
jgi:hypothetical protein